MDISIILATHNRACLLRRTLESLEKLDTEGVTWEILIVDNASEDEGETAALLKEYESKLPLTVLEEAVPGKNRALNKALALAQGELFVFTDNDIVADTKWIKNLWEASERWPDADIFGGKIIPLFPEHAPDWLENMKRTYYDGYGPCFGDFSPHHEECYTMHRALGANLAIRAKVFQSYSYCESIGPCGKHYPMGSETELLSRLLKDGKKCVYVPSASVWHIIEEFQLTTQWLHQRMYRLGWGRSYRERHLSPRTFRGVPLYLWRKLFFSWLCYRFAFFSSSAKKRELGMRYHYHKGFLDGALKKRHDK